MTQVHVPDDHPLEDLATTIAGLTGIEPGDAVLGLALLGAQCIGCGYPKVLAISELRQRHLANVRFNLVLRLIHATQGIPITFD